MTDMPLLIHQLPAASLWLPDFVFIVILLPEGVNDFQDAAHAVTRLNYANSQKPNQETSRKTVSGAPIQPLSTFLPYMLFRHHRQLR